MSALSKAMLADKITNNDVTLSKTDAKKVIEIFFEHISYALELGQNVKLSGFGNFILRDKSERPGRNPKTGEEIAVSSRRVVTFKPGLKLKSKVESNPKKMANNHASTC